MESKARTEMESRSSDDSVQSDTRSSEVEMRILRIVFGSGIGTGVGVSAVGCGRGFTGRTLVNATEPPVIPVGLDAFRMWDRWAYLRIGQRTYMTSTYDRRGGNETADASHFLYQLADDRNVSLDVMGPGVLAFVRNNHWHGSPWHYIVDGRDHVVQEIQHRRSRSPGRELGLHARRSSSRTR